MNDMLIDEIDTKSIHEDSYLEGEVFAAKQIAKVFENVLAEIDSTCIDAIKKEEYHRAYRATEMIEGIEYVAHCIQNTTGWVMRKPAPEVRPLDDGL